VLRNKDASSLPLHLCAMVFIQCSSWTIYGALRNDLSTFANNAVGVVLGAVQLYLIFKYPSRRTPHAVASADMVGKKREAGGEADGGSDHHATISSGGGSGGGSLSDSGSDGAAAPGRDNTGGATPVAITAFRDGIDLRRPSPHGLA
jgi:hypothetical protein